MTITITFGKVVSTIHVPDGSQVAYGVHNFDRLLQALQQIATIKERIPFDAADAATECIRIAKEALK